MINFEIYRHAELVSASFESIMKALKQVQGDVYKLEGRIL